MPPLVLHAASAKKIADRLQLHLLDEERGQVYLGSTAPDIRVITGFDRRRTHFFDLDDFEEQSGVETFFHAYPCLGNSSAISAATAAFVAGYLTHLVMDETWIKTIYRPYFGERSSLGGSLRGRHLHPSPRVAEALAIAGAAPIRSMIDLSDGLSSDLGHILEESGGLGATLVDGAIPIHEDEYSASPGLCGEAVGTIQAPETAWNSLPPSSIEPWL